MKKCFEIIYRDKNSNARVGLLKTKTGEHETPFFMPVATKGAAKYVDMDELDEMGATSFISNSFLLYLKPGLDVVKKHGGLHGFTNWKKCIFTDSGGFQVLSLENFKGRVTDEGLRFRSVYDGKEHLLTPEKVMEIEQSLGADVAMALDHMPLAGATRDEVVVATKRTHEWAQRCLNAHSDEKQLLFGIIQGGSFSDVRKKSAEFISKLNFDGIAVGGVAIGEPNEKTLEMIKISLEIIPEEKPRYVMGVGSVNEIVESVALGVDMFDSVFPTRNARHGKIMTWSDDLNIENGMFKEDLSPLDKKCSCKVCKKHTRAYLHHLYRMKEPLGMKLLSYHNLFFMQDLMRTIRKAIREGTFEELRGELAKSRDILY